jgi:hypothetical protein
MASRRSVKLTKLAHEQITAIYDEFEQAGTHQQALSFIDSLLDVGFSEARDFPDRFPYYTTLVHVEMRNRYRLAHLKEGYCLLFEVLPDSVVLSVVLDETDLP